MSPDAQGEPPEGSLIRLAREARGLSPETAADLTAVRLGGGRWRQIERGYKGRGQIVRAPARTLAHMAHVVGVSPGRLHEAGRGDAAQVLQEILRQEAEATQEPSAGEEMDPRTQAIIDLLETLSPEEQEEVLRRYRKPSQQRPDERRPRRTG